MKKKLFSLFTLLVMIFSLTGCIKYNATMEIKSDKSMDFTIIYGFSKSLLEMSNQTDGEENQEAGGNVETSGEVMKEEDIQKLRDAGFEVNEYSDDTYKGYTITKKIANIDEYSSETDVEYSLSGVFDEKSDAKIFKVEKGTTKNTYTANFKFDANEADTGLENDPNAQADASENSDAAPADENNTDLSQLGETLASTMDLKYVVKLPSPALSSNATSKNEDGTELTWKLTTEAMDNISFKFELENPTVASANTTTGSSSLLSNKGVLFGGIGLFLLVVIILIIVFVRGNKKNKGDAVQTATPAESVAPVAQPTAPVAPVTPVAQPTAPVEPVAPVAQPTTPVEPVAPVAQPTAPVEPVAPVAQPTAPVEPVAPVAQPTAPVEPVTPVAQPTAPVEPVAPVAQPTAPVAPTQPDSTNNPPLS